MRQIALCETLQQRGHRVTICCPDPGSRIAERLQSRSIETHFLEADSPHQNAVEYLRSTHRGDPVQTAVLDDYRFNADDESAVRGLGIVVCSMSDIPSRDYAADIVVNPTQPNAQESPYILSAGASLLRGPQYACVRSDFLDPLPSRGRSSPCRILVSFGGADPLGLTAIFRSQLTATPDLPGEYRFVLGPALNLERQPALTQQVSDPRQEVISTPRNMADQIGWSDLVVSAAGSTVWETCAIGKAMIVVAVADNQQPIADTLSAHRAAVLIGGQGTAGEIDFITPVRELLATPARMEALACSAKTLVDGRGATRVAETLEQRAINGATHDAT
jgi:UDP-2,4-diacetamido-2,4,6-trideoxy-beta-L-altropyranose hydrolase